MTLSTPAKIRPGTPAVARPNSPTADCGPTPIVTAPSSRDLRTALGSFATGVTVITALAPDGERIGLTISSFNSVSLDPPLILWSLSLSSPKLEAFSRASHYAVNILAADQRWLSDRFAGRDSDRFADLPQHVGLCGAPLIDGCCAWFECANEAHYPGGDHRIFVGRVERFVHNEAASPLVFHNGRYRQLAPLTGD